VGENPTILKQETHDRAQLVSLANAKLFPRGLEPTLALKEAWLVVASSPLAVRRFSEPRPSGPSLDDGAGVLLARLSVREALTYLADPERRQALVEALAHNHQASIDQVRQRFESVMDVLALFDRIELVQFSGPDHAILTLRIRPARPLHTE
jgi:hypothetical protein